MRAQAARAALSLARAPSRCSGSGCRWGLRTRVGAATPRRRARSTGAPSSSPRAPRGAPSTPTLRSCPCCAWRSRLPTPRRLRWSPRGTRAPTPRRAGVELLPRPVREHARDLVLGRVAGDPGAPSRLACEPPRAARARLASPAGAEPHRACACKPRRARDQCAPRPLAHRAKRPDLSPCEPPSPRVGNALALALACEAPRGAGECGFARGGAYPPHAVRLDRARALLERAVDLRVEHAHRLVAQAFADVLARRLPPAAARRVE